MDQRQLQRRTIVTLMSASAFGFAGFAAIASILTLLSSDLLGSDSVAGLPAAAGTLGTALVAAPLAARSKRRGRREGLLAGYSIAIVGCAVGFAAAQLGSFWLLVLAMAAMGAGHAANLQNRFAAADLAEEEERASAISLVVWVGTIGAVLGSPAAIWANRVGVTIGVAEWGAPLLLGFLGFILAGVIISGRLRPDPLEASGGLDPDAPRENPLSGAGRTLKAVWPNFDARLALVAMSFSQMAMVAVMVMTPLHMKEFGHEELSILVIAVHVVGMYGLSPLVGRFADRFGRVRAVQVGAVVLATGTVSVVIAGYSPALMFGGLFLLGLGWSFSLIAGSALLTESLPVPQRVPAQGLADVLMSLFAAVAAFASGFVNELVGFHWLANFATLSAVLVLIGATWVRSRQPVLAELEA